MQDHHGRRVRRRLTYANVMSSLAVFLVIAGGTALAATTLPRNSVSSPTVKNGSLTGADLKNGSIGRADLSLKGEFPLMEIGEKSVTVPPGGSATVTAECPPGNEGFNPRVISGGGSFANESGALSASRANWNIDPAGWLVSGTNNGKTPQTLTAEALCILIQ